MSAWLAIILAAMFVSLIALLLRKSRPAVGPTTLEGGPGVREPVPKRPPAMSGAVVVAEPDEE